MINLYRLRVYPAGMSREVDRTIDICGRDTLDTLCGAIMEAFNFIHEHLYEFCMDNRMYSDNAYEYMPEDPGRSSTNIKIDRLHLQKGQNFSLHYDYGDDWMFTIHVQSITKTEAYVTPRLIKGKGEIEQYPTRDDEDWDEEDEEN